MVNTMAYVATIGFFDGVHLGHRYLLDQLTAEAAHRNMESAVLTFEHHPKIFLNHPDLPLSPSGAPLGRTGMPLLCTFQERTELLKSLGVREIFCFRFDLVRQMTAREFMQVLKDKCGVEVLMMGYDHRFGSDKPAQITDYIQIGAELGLEVIPVNQAPEGDVSSSKIRKALMLGDLSEANAMLGYPYTITGTVVHGRGIGHQLGFPTANLLVADEKMIPRSGVYAVRWNGQKAILNIGTNPTVSGDAAGIVTLELHIPEMAQDTNLYGQKLQLSLIRRIRDEKKFASLDELKTQISEDLKNL